MGKHIIITWSMIPFTNNWGGCQRMYYLADSLTAKGDSVEIICAYEGIFDPGADHDHTTHVYDIKGNMVTKDDLLHLSSLSEQKKRTRSNHTEMVQGIVMQTVSVIAKAVNYILNESSPRKGLKVYTWLLKNSKNIEDVVRRSGCDDVIISGPPHTLFLLVRKLKKLGCRIILDYRDPWNTWRVGYPLSRRIERKCLNIADGIVCTNKNMRESLINDFRVNSLKIHIIGNGYSKKRWNSIGLHEERKENFVISYIGSINLKSFASFRDCKNVIDAFVKFNGNHKNTRLKFVGVNDFSNQLLEEYKRKNIEIQGKVTVDESFRIMGESDVLMLMHTAEDMSGKYIVSAKLYDYIAADKPVIGIGHTYDLHKEIIEKENIGIFCENDESEIEAAFENLYRKWRAGDLKAECRSKKEYTREFQNRIYVKLLNGESDA